MAARENQGYLIGIIVLSIIAVTLLLITVLTSMSAVEYHDKWQASVTEATVNKARADAYKFKSDMQSAMIGVEGATPGDIGSTLGLFDGAVSRSNQDSEVIGVRDSAQAIKAIYDDDMKLNAAASAAGESAEADMTWKGTIAKLSASMGGLNTRLYANNQESRRIQQDAEERLSNMKATLDERTATLSETQAASAEEKKRNALKEEELRNRALAIQESMNTLAKEAQDSLAIKENAIEVLEKSVNDLTASNVALKTKVDRYESEDFDLPDGNVVQVSPAAGTVFVNLGRKDGLKVNRTFVIYDQTATDFAKDQHKAKIEITEILGDHSARARVTEEDPKDPILTKDYVLTPTWDPGDSTPIALGGFFDLDGDGFSDREKLIQMIERNGGTVVAWHDEDGNITGEIDSATRYFVEGPSGINGSSRAANAAVALRDQAKSNTVQTINLRKLLNWMGVHGNANVQRLDGRPSGPPTGSGSGFKERFPSR